MLCIQVVHVHHSRVRRSLNKVRRSHILGLEFDLVNNPYYKNSLPRNWPCCGDPKESKEGLSWWWLRNHILNSVGDRRIIRIISFLALFWASCFWHAPATNFKVTSACFEHSGIILPIFPIYSAFSHRYGLMLQDLKAAQTCFRLRESSQAEAKMVSSCIVVRGGAQVAINGHQWPSMAMNGHE